MKPPRHSEKLYVHFLFLRRTRAFDGVENILRARSREAVTNMAAIAGQGKQTSPTSADNIFLFPLLIRYNSTLINLTRV